MLNAIKNLLKLTNPYSSSHDEHYNCSDNGVYTVLRTIVNNLASVHCAAYNSK